MATGKQVIAALTAYEESLSGHNVPSTIAERITAMHAALDAAMVQSDPAAAAPVCGDPDCLICSNRG